MGQIPPEYADLIKKLMPDFSNVNAYLYSQWFSKNLQQVGAIFAVILLSSAVAGERELHTAIFLFSRPVSRGMILASKVIVLFAGLVLTVLVSTGGAVLGAVIVGKVPQAAFVLTATLHSAHCAAHLCIPCDVALRTRAGPHEGDALLGRHHHRSFGRGPVQTSSLAQSAGAVWKLRPHPALCTAAGAHCRRRDSECLHAVGFAPHSAATGVLVLVSHVLRRPRCCVPGLFSVSAIPGRGFVYNGHGTTGRKWVCMHRRH